MKKFLLLFVALIFIFVMESAHATTFGIPAPVGIGTTYSGITPSISADELTMFLSVDLGGTQSHDIFYATRPNKYVSFGDVISLSEINTSEMEWGPDISADGLSLYFARGINWNGDIYVATRASTSEPFGTPQIITELSTLYSEAGPSISADGLAIYFAGNMLGNISDLFMATRPDVNSPFGTPVALNTLNTAHNEAAPAITPDGLTIYFRRMYEGGMQQDIWAATRPDTNSMFGVPFLVAELNYPGFSSYGPDVSFDGQTIYFASDRPGSLPGNIWMATVIPEPASVILLLFGVAAVLKKRL